MPTRRLPRARRGPVVDVARGTLGVVAGAGSQAGGDRSEGPRVDRVGEALAADVGGPARLSWCRRPW
jgi:hypothetical protein